MSKFTDKVKVFIHPPFGHNDEPKPAPDDMRARFLDAGWSDDPGTGRAVLLPDGRELLNPVPMAPPIGYKPELSMMDMIHQQVAKHLATINDGLVVDDAADADDFDVGEEFDPFSLYEITEMAEDMPPLPAAKPPEVLADTKDIIPKSDPPPVVPVSPDPVKS